MSEENKQQRSASASAHGMQGMQGMYGMGMAQGMYQTPGYSPYYPSYASMQQPSFYPSYSYQTPTQAQPQQQPNGPQTPGMLPLEQSYVENILRLNRGKVATIYMTFDNNERWNAKIFRGRVEAAGRDHIIISDLETDKRYLLLTIYLDYISFDERIEYDLPFGQQQQLPTASQR